MSHYDKQWANSINMGKTLTTGTISNAKVAYTKPYFVAGDYIAESTGEVARFSMVVDVPVDVLLTDHIAKVINEKGYSHKMLITSFNPL